MQTAHTMRTNNDDLTDNAESVCLSVCLLLYSTGANFWLILTNCGMRHPSQEWSLAVNLGIGCIVAGPRAVTVC